MEVIGFVGTAKNTGKTTTAIHMLGLFYDAQLNIALTSIGYDGENKDHVTGLPKPRYYAKKGTLIATAEACLALGSAEYNDIQGTGLRTILGEIVIATLATDGFVVLAGPNRRVDLESLLRKLELRGCDVIMIDGALNRLAAMIVADGLVISTGAAFYEGIEMIAGHAAAMESLFHYPRYSGSLPLEPGLVACMEGGKCIHQLDYGSVLKESIMRQIGEWFSPGRGAVCFLPGVFQPQLFEALLEDYLNRIKGNHFVFRSPINLLASGDPLTWQACLSKLKANECKIEFMETIDLCFMTVNPFYPKYLQKTGNYVAAYVDAEKLLQMTRGLIDGTPVVDIYSPPHPDLLKLCQIN